MTTNQAISFIRRRIRVVAEQARRQPETAQSAYRYFELVRRWATRNGIADLADATREAKDYIIEVAA